MICIETSAILAALKTGEEGESMKLHLQEILDQAGHVSELLLSEIYNLDEPRKEWAAQLFNELPFPILRVNPEVLELANRYVYNKVFDSNLRDLGAHAALATIRECEGLLSLDNRMLNNTENIARINKVAGYNTPRIFSAHPQKTWLADEELDNIRSLSWRVTNRKKAEETARSIQEMANNFLKEKSINLRKVGKIEIF